MTAAPRIFDDTDASAFVRHGEDGSETLHLLVDGLHCTNCIRKVETEMHRMPGVVDARVNLSTRRLTLRWLKGESGAGDFLARLDALGYPAVPFEPDTLKSQGNDENAFLLRCLAVAGFAAGNVMLLSVSVWAGAFSDMEAVTRTMMHWVSALIALPAIAYSGRPFFRSALRAVSSRRVNMDVPISVAVLITAAVSLFEVTVDGPHAYFDAAVMLVFFLLIGRYLDFRARGAMRSTAENLAALTEHPAVLIDDAGGRRVIPARSVAPGQIVSVAAGERVPVDGIVSGGESSLDMSLLSGESAPVAVASGDAVYAGTLNIGSPMFVRAQAAGGNTVLADIVRLVEDAEQGRSAYVRLADRAARLYAPVVHLLALATLLGWWLAGGATFHAALLIAVAVLIITCPCALGLAVPAVQVVATGRLMRQGVVTKSGDALERLAVADTVVLDKTGTLTLGRPEIVNAHDISADNLRLAASLAVSSRHPLCMALVRAAGTVPVRDGVAEIPGMGLKADGPGPEIRLGNREFCGIGDEEGTDTDTATELWLAVAGRTPVCFRFADRLRPDARAFVDWCQARGLAVELLSGDRKAAVRDVAETLGIVTWHAGMRPADKAARLEAHKSAGRKVFMVGDGLNDAPSLAGAFVSASPATGANISQAAADFVFQSDALKPLAAAVSVAALSRRMVIGNFGLATGYNILAIPLAVAGFVTPLIAAVAMSASSLLVTGNAMRLFRRRLGLYE